MRFKFFLVSFLWGIFLVLSLSPNPCKSMFAPNSTSPRPGQMSIVTAIGQNLSSTATTRPSSIMVRPAPKPKQVYFDLTKQIDTALGGSSKEFLKLVEKLKPHKSKILLHSSAPPAILYKTDRLISDLEDIAPVASLLDQNQLEDTKIYLQFNANQENQFSDIFHSTPSKPSDPVGKSLSKHISGVLLDFQQNHCDDYYYYDNYKRSAKNYEKKMGVSYTKHARKIIKALLGKDNGIKIGAIFNSTQFHCFNLIQHLKDADFFVLNLEFSAGKRFPMSYVAFKQYLIRSSFESFSNFLKYEGNDRNVTTELKFKINLKEVNSSTIFRFYDGNVEDNEIKNEIMDKASGGYFRILKRYAKRWAKEEGKGDILIETDLKIDESQKNGLVKAERDSLLPYLYAQESDISPCQMQTLLGETAKKYSALVVNEFTWSALAHFDDRNEMLPTSCPKSTVLPSLTTPETMLLFTIGIGSIWNKTEENFQRLLLEHQSISGFNLTTIVFSSLDIKRVADDVTDCKNSYTCSDVDSFSKDFGMVRLATEMKENGNYKIGCLIEFGSNFFRNTRIIRNLNQTTAKECGGGEALWDITSVIVWKFNIEFERKMALEFSFDSDSYFGLKGPLMQVLVDREKLMREHPEKEVIIQISLWRFMNRIEDEKRYYMAENAYYYNNSSVGESRNNCSRSETIFEMNSFHESILTWGRVHGVRLILNPVVDMEYPELGLERLPAEDGTPRKIGEDCKEKDDLMLRRLSK